MKSQLNQQFQKVIHYFVTMRIVNNLFRVENSNTEGSIIQSVWKCNKTVNIFETSFNIHSL